ncbi:hypothetical protein TNCV_468031 [Trichonephila clavipes]|nr:hypothetical protein TNCV_468031 [Trichonephila clavipes]
MFACRIEFHIACMHSKSSPFEDAGCGSRARRQPTKSHTCSIYDRSGEEAGQAVDQRAANCLDEAVRSFTTMWRFQSSLADVTFRHSLPDFRVVLCSSVHCFQTCITVEIELILRDRKILLLEGRLSPPFKFRKLLKCLLISSWMHTLTKRW